jgi:hypothetical protein
LISLPDQRIFISTGKAVLSFFKFQLGKNGRIEREPMKDLNRFYYYLLNEQKEHSQYLEYQPALVIRQAYTNHQENDYAFNHVRKI